MATVGIYLGDRHDPTSNIAASLPPFVRTILDAGHDVELFGDAVPFPPSQLDDRCTQFEIDADGGTTIPQKLFTAYQVCRKYCQTREPDILMQFWKFTAHAPPVAAAGARTRTATITRFNGDIFRQHRVYDGGMKFAVKGFNQLSHAAIRLADGAIAFGPYGRKQLQSHGMDGDIAIVPPSADLDDRFAPPDDPRAIKREIGLPTDRTVALYVGRITDAKGMDYLHEVVTRTDSTVQFVLVGGGAGESDTVEHKIVTAFDNSVVMSEGKVPHEEIHRYYQAADIYVSPSAHEGIPLTAIEARQCGLPIIARPAGDIAMVTNDVVHNPGEMARKLRQGDWSEDWGTEFPFSEDYQRDTLGATISSITKNIE